MLISICGPQGSGKSTLIDGIINNSRFFEKPVKVIERKTARSILTDWNTTLQEVYSSPAKIMDFQDELLKRKYLDERIAINDDVIWITERSYIDLLAYTTSNIGRFNQYGEWLQDYADKCNKYQLTYDAVIHIPGCAFKIEDDGVRPTSEVYSIMIDAFITKYLGLSASPHHTMISDDVEGRIREAVQLIETIEFHSKE